VNVRAVFVDASGTLLKPRAPIGVTYAHAALRHGHALDPVAVQVAFREALRRPRAHTQAGDGRAFWREIVAESTGVADEGLFEALYQHYASPRAWWIDTVAIDALTQLARRGIRLGVISNFDLRLREIWHRMALDRLLGVLVCSAEVELEKPDPEIFRLACRVAGVMPHEAVHIGDDPVNDVEGASRAGLYGMLHADEDDWRALPATIARLGRYAGRPGGTVFGT
jgi:putative hydrolase of the HAD superfamily